MDGIMGFSPTAGPPKSDSSSILPISIGVLAQPTKALYKFLGVLANQSPIEIRVTAVWGPTEADATAVARLIKVLPSRTFWNKDTKGGGLRAVYEHTGVDALAIVLPVDIHAATLLSLFGLSPPPPRRKALLSVTPCSYGSKQLQQLIQLYYACESKKGPLFLWSILEPLRYEPFINRVSAITADLGQILGGSLVMSGHWASHITDEATHSDRVPLAMLCKGAAAVLRNIFGCVVEVRAQLSPFDDMEEKKDPSAATAVVGAIRFACGPIVSVSLCSKSLEAMTLTIVGTNGNAIVEWDAAKGGFEVQRHLSHFEHPVVDAPNGFKWSLTAWARCVSSSGPENGDVSSPLTALVDYLIGEALLESRGSSLLFSAEQTALSAISWNKEKSCAMSYPVSVSKLERKRKELSAMK